MPPLRGSRLPVPLAVLSHSKSKRFVDAHLLELSIKSWVERARGVKARRNWHLGEDDAVPKESIVGQGQLQVISHYKVSGHEFYDFSRPFPERRFLVPVLEAQQQRHRSRHILIVFSNVPQKLLSVLQSKRGPLKATGTQVWIFVQIQKIQTAETRD